MKKLWYVAALAACASPVWAADVGVSVSIGQPGFYGTIDIGNFPRPQVINTRPIVIQARPNVFVRPVYLHVPPGHAKKWSKHCDTYNACGRPVYFVQNNWYNEVYVKNYRGDDDSDHHGKGKHGRGRGHD